MPAKCQTAPGHLSIPESAHETDAPWRQVLHNLVNKTLSNTQSITRGCAGVLNDAGVGCTQQVTAVLEDSWSEVLSGLLQWVPDIFANSIQQLALSITDAELPWYELDGLVPQVTPSPRRPTLTRA